VVGAFEDIEYDDHTMTLKNNEKLFLYTDGVTEAFSEADEQFGERRLEEILVQNKNISEDETIKTMQDTLTKFAGKCEQSDDITMLVIARK
jgi:sigma-B regulation protein RsbU (phosphoserine phosphatase)